MKISCIYIIKSKVKPERFYIGSAVDFLGRKRSHLYCLKNSKHVNRKLQNHVNKYGITDLSFEFLERILDKDTILGREQYYIDLYNPSFNICKIAGNTSGRKVSEETRKKISISNTGRKRSAESIKKSADALKGRKRAAFSEEHKNKIKMAHIGKVSDETLLKIRETRSKKVFIPWNKGKTGIYSEEVLKVMSEKRRLARIGYKHSEETKRKMSASSIGKPKNKESVIKMKETKRINRLKLIA